MENTRLRNRLPIWQQQRERQLKSSLTLINSQEKMVVHFDKIITNLKVSYFYLTILLARGRQYDLDSKLFTKCNTKMFLQNRTGHAFHLTSNPLKPPYNPSSQPKSTKTPPNPTKQGQILMGTGRAFHLKSSLVNPPAVEEATSLW